MEEAKGKYINKTIYIWQIKNVSRHYYQDNMTSDDLEYLKDWADRNQHKNLDTRIIKRTVKEDII